jgi:hypothetical protein
MIMDAYLLLSDAQAFTATAVSTNTIDLGGTNRDIGTGTPMVAMMTIDVAADAGTGDETYEFQIITSASADLSSPTVIASRVISRTALLLGTLHYLDVPMGGVIAQRYLGARLVLGGTTPSVTATIAIIPRDFATRWTSYPGVF